MSVYFTLLSSVAIVFAGAALFTNGLEWFGKKAGFSDRAIGTVFAAVGTALPETAVPLIAIFHGGGGHAIATGAIIGAPFMLSTAAMFLLGLALVFKRPGGALDLDGDGVRRDLSAFLALYAVAIAASFVGSPHIKTAMALLLVSLYLYYAYSAIKSEKGEGEEALERFYFAPRSEDPPMALVSLQAALAIVLIVWGADLFVDGVRGLADRLGASPFLVSLLVVPLATELPEKINSLVWVSKGKDRLAVGNITGAMVFQSSLITAIGILFTSWELDRFAYASVAATFASAGTIYLQLLRGKRITAAPLLAGGLFYLLFALYALH